MGSSFSLPHDQVKAPISIEQFEAIELKQLEPNKPVIGFEPIETFQLIRPFEKFEPFKVRNLLFSFVL